MKLLKLYLGILLLITSFCSCKQDEVPNDSVSKEVEKEDDDNNDKVLNPDSNLYGIIKDEAGNGIPNVVVTDGYKCVATDQEGFYQMRRNQKTKFVYISSPSDFEIPVSADGYPSHYSRAAAWPTKIEQNFTLKKHESPENKFIIYALADPQCKNLTHLNRYKKETMEDIQNMASSEKLPVYGIMLGDIGYDNVAIFEDMRKAMSLGGIPIFPVLGNHDKEKDGSNMRSTEKYEASFGPKNFSFNRGNVHFIGLDNVHYTDGSNYKNTFSKEQVDWVREDLNFVSQDKMIVLYYHVPMRGSTDANWINILTMLSKYHNVRLICGHTHYAETYLNSSTYNNIKEDILAAVSGAWWFSDINGDGTPNGYAVYTFDNNEIVGSYYKPTNGDKNNQIRLHRGSDVTGGSYETFIYNIFTSQAFTDNTIIANIWNANKYWKVQISENGAPFQDMTYIENAKDSWSIGYHVGVIGRGHTASEGTGGTPGGNRNNYLTPCKHLYYFEPDDPKSTFKVIATDEFGYKYEQDIFTAGKDYTEALAK